jgi:ribosomal protein L12E/L44/L45/RPP1/RPP2
LTNKYDHVVLAGASAGALGKLGADWASTFWKHVDTAIQLHHVRELIVVDHRDCGAFKIVFGAESIAERGRETNLHRTLLHKLRAEVGARHPTLRTQLLLMDLEGKVEDLSAATDAEVAAAPAGGGAPAHEAAASTAH